MYKYITLLIIAFSISTLSAQKKVDHVLRKYKNDENVVNINLTGDLSSMLNKAELDLKTKVTLLDIIMFSEGDDLKPKHKQDIKNAIANEGFELLVNVKDKGGKVKIYTIENDKYINKLYANVNAKGMNIYVILEGDIYYDELSKLDLGFDGADIFKGALPEGNK